MGYSTSLGYTDSIAATQNYACPQLNFDADYALKSETANEVVLVNKTTPADQVESVRFAINDVKNVYTGEQDIDPTMYAPVKKGKSLVCSVKETLRVTNSDSDGNILNQYDLPVQCHFVLKFPVSANFDATVAETIVKRMMATATKAVQASGSWTSSFRLGDLIRGALNPKKN